MKKQAVVSHSGGMDSSICLRLAIEEYGVENVLSMGFNYGQRNSPELEVAEIICRKWEVDRIVLDVTCMGKITDDAMTNHALDIEHQEGQAPNTLVVGRNGLMGRLCAIHAHSLGAAVVYMGVMGLEGENSGYRDCSREYVDKLEAILRLDLDAPNFTILTPLVNKTKAESLALAGELGELGFLWDITITCYEGIPREGCKTCPACILRNQGMMEYSKLTL